MSDTNTKTQYLAAIGIGVVHAIILAAIWRVLAVEQPISAWIRSSYAGIWNEALLRSLIYAHDLLINLIVAIPFALLIARLGHGGSWKYLWISVSVSFLVVNWSVFTNHEWLIQVSGMWSFYAGSFVTVVALPLVFTVITRIKSRDNVA